MKKQINDKKFEKIRWECLIRSPKFLNFWEEFKTEMNNIQKKCVIKKCTTLYNIEDEINKAHVLTNDCMKRLRDRFGNITFVADMQIILYPIHHLIYYMHLKINLLMRSGKSVLPALKNKNIIIPMKYPEQI